MNTPEDIFDWPRLFGIAYRMLGSAPDTEDILQKTYILWIASNPSDQRSTETWLRL